MNNNNLDKFIQDLESIKMTTQEKEEMRNHLASFAVSYTPTVSPYQHVSFIMRRTLAFSFIALLSIGSLTNLASGQALPGDTLYPVKIVHEEIKLATTINTKKKISYEIRRTEKRIQEAAELVTQQDLDEEAQIKIAAKIKQQTNKVQRHIQEVEEESPKDALVLNNELKSTIEINSVALRQVSTTTERKKKDGVPVLETPEDLVEDGAVAIMALPADGDITPSEEGETKDVKDAEVKQEIDTKEVAENEDEYVDVEFSSAERLLAVIQEQIQDIESKGVAISIELTKDEQDSDEPVAVITYEEGTTETIPLEEIPTKNSSEVTIHDDIKSLNDILEIGNKIKKAKAELGIEDDIVKEDFNETDIYLQVDVLISEARYKRAFVLLNEVREYYQELSITKNVESDLGIDIKESTSKPTAKPTEEVKEVEKVVEAVEVSEEVKENLPTPEIDIPIIDTPQGE